MPLPLQSKPNLNPKKFELLQQTVQTFKRLQRGPLLTPEAPVAEEDEEDSNDDDDDDSISTDCQLQSFSLFHFRFSRGSSNGRAMVAPEPEDEKSWQELLRKMLPSGAPLPDDDHLDYSIAVEYEGPPLPYEVPKVDPVDIDSLHSAASGASGSVSELSSIPVAEPVDRDASRFSRIRNGDAANETQTSTSFSVGFSSEFSAQDSNSEPKPVEDEAGGGGGKRAAVVTFNTLRESETEDDGDRSSLPQSEPVGSPVAWASPLKVASKRGICSRCGKGNRLKEREWCLVCDSKYCSNCLLKAMGSMPEGRKCVSCIGQPINVFMVS